MGRLGAPPHYCQVGVEVQVSYWAFMHTLWLGGVGMPVPTPHATPTDIMWSYYY